MSGQRFEYDVFLSHAAADKAAVRELAERLKGDGLRVWLDEWVIQPGDMVSLRIEQGLESSRTLVLVMSQAAFDSEWVTLERHTALFRDPTNQQRRFIPLRLDDCDIKDLLKQFAYVDWRQHDDEQYAALLDVCALTTSQSDSPRPTSLSYDVFVSHAPEDRDQAARIVTHLENAGLRVWLTRTVIRPGDVIPDVIARGLNTSRVFLLVISKRALGPEWAMLEHHSAAFREPTNESRRFLPIVVDDCDIPPTIGRYKCIDLRQWDEDKLEQLVRACFSAGRTQPARNTPAEFHSSTFTAFELHGGAVESVSISCDGRFAVSGASDSSIKLWNLETSKCLTTFLGHTEQVTAVAFARQDDVVVSGSKDKTIRIWSTKTMECLECLSGTLTSEVAAIAVAPCGTLAVVGLHGGRFSIIDLTTATQLYTIDAHGAAITSVSVDALGSLVVTAAEDNAMKVWDAKTGDCLVSLEGVSRTNTVALTSDCGTIVAGSEDGAVSVWDTTKRRLVSSFEGHTRAVNGLVLTPDDSRAISASSDGTIRIWDLKTGVEIAQAKYISGLTDLDISQDGHRIVAGSRSLIEVWELPSQVETTRYDVSRYTNAKALLVGDSGVGKTGLAIRLTKNTFEPTASTDAHWATQLKLPLESQSDDIDREIWVWDFAGQADYRLIHQLFMDETALAVLVFNPQSENPFDGLGQWDRDLKLAARREFTKLLVAGRCDRGGLMVSREAIDNFVRGRDFGCFLQTSAKTGEGCDELLEAIEQSIDWDSIPWTASPRIFKLLKEEIIRLSDEGFTLLRMSELKQQLEMRLLGENPTSNTKKAVESRGLLSKFFSSERSNPESAELESEVSEENSFTYGELTAVVGLLAGPGHVWQLEFGQFVLLHPERINSYAAAVGRTVRSHLQQIGVIHESAMLAGQLNFGDIERLPPREEAIVLRAMHQTLVDHGFCLTQETDAGPLLVFPSYFNRERRDQIDHPRIFGTFRFSGALEELYATLVVKLHHTRTFETEELWRYAADFKCVSGGQVGLKMRKLGEGDAEIMAYCDPGLAVESKVTFIQYIHEHLKRYDPEVTLIRHYVCRNPECEEAVSDVKAILRAREKGLTQLPCQYCFEPIPLWDELEEELASEKYEARVREMEATSRAGIKRESRDLMLEYHAFAIAEETSQQFVPIEDEEVGVHARIDLQNLEGKPSKHCLHLQLRPAEVYKSVTTNRDGNTVFEVGSKKLIERWEQSESPMMLVHRTDDGYIRWMDVGAFLRKKGKSGKTAVKQIVFDGEPFTALNLQRMRERLFSRPT